MKHNLRIIIPMLIMLIATMGIFNFYSRVAEDQLFVETTIHKIIDGGNRHEATLQVDWKWVNFRARQKGQVDLVIVDLDSKWDWKFIGSSQNPQSKYLEDKRIQQMNLRNPYIFEVKEEGKVGNLTLTFGEDFPQLPLKAMDAKVYYVHDSASPFSSGAKGISFIKTTKVKYESNEINNLAQLKDIEEFDFGYCTVVDPQPKKLTENLSKELLEEILQSNPIDEFDATGMNFDRILEIPGSQALTFDNTGRFMKFEFSPTIYELHRPISYKLNHLVLDNNGIYNTYDKQQLYKGKVQDKEVVLLFSGDLELWVDNKLYKIHENLVDDIELQKIEFVPILKEKDLSILIQYRAEEMKGQNRNQFLKIVQLKNPEVVLFDSVTGGDAALVKDGKLGDIIKVSFANMDKDQEKEMWIQYQVEGAKDTESKIVNTYYDVGELQFQRAQVIFENTTKELSQTMSALFDKRPQTPRQVGRTLGIPREEAENRLRTLLGKGVLKVNEVKVMNYKYYDYFINIGGEA